MSKLTKRFVDDLLPSDKDYLVWDTELKGFGVRIYPTGRKQYVVQYRANGRSRRTNVGQYNVMTAEEARKEARLIQADVARGADPSAEHKAILNGPKMNDLRPQNSSNLM